MARAAAEAAASNNDYPQGALYVVATPIGNLADIKPADFARARAHGHHCLRDITPYAGAAACLWTGQRRSTLLAVHEHNESQAATRIAALRAGQQIAYVSDAGTPASATPVQTGGRCAGQGLKRAAARRQQRYSHFCSRITRFIGAEAGFIFRGFLPSKSASAPGRCRNWHRKHARWCCWKRRTTWRRWPKSLATLGERRITVGRELTKQFEGDRHPARSVLTCLAAGRRESAAR